MPPFIPKLLGADRLFGGPELLHAGQDPREAGARVGRGVGEPWVPGIARRLVADEEVVDAERGIVVELRAEEARHRRPHSRPGIGLFRPTHAPPRERRQGLSGEWGPQSGAFWGS